MDRLLTLDRVQPPCPATPSSVAAAVASSALVARSKGNSRPHGRHICSGRDIVSDQSERGLAAFASTQAFLMASSVMVSLKRLPIRSSVTPRVTRGAPSPAFHPDGRACLLEMEEADQFAAHRRIRGCLLADAPQRISEQHADARTGESCLTAVCGVIGLVDGSGSVSRTEMDVMDGCMDAWMDGYMHMCIHTYMHACMHAWEGCMG